MKITKNIKTLLVLAISLFFANNVSAQDSATENYDQSFRLGIGVTAGYVFDEPYGLGLGADARLQYDLSKRYSLTLTTGFTNLFVDGKGVNGKGNDLGFIPAKLGFKAFVWNDQFYIMGEGGAAFAVTNNYDKTSLLLAPSIGYATKFMDYSLRYEHYSDFAKINDNGTLGKGIGQLSLRIAYGFEL